jgi:lipopolysaccharide export system protein LptA
MRLNSYFLLLFFCCAAAVAETKGPIQVEADRLELDQKKGISLYQGHVRLERGNTLLQAERLELHSEAGKVTQAIADGQPVHMEMRDQESGKIARAEAQHVDYRFNEGLIELQGAAQLWREGDHFSGERLLYDDNKQQLRAFGSEQSNGRVRVILQPEKEQKQ